MATVADAITHREEICFGINVHSDVLHSAKDVVGDAAELVADKAGDALEGVKHLVKGDGDKSSVFAILGEGGGAAPSLLAYPLNEVSP